MNSSNRECLYECDRSNLLFEREKKLSCTRSIEIGPLLWNSHSLGFKGVGGGDTLNRELIFVNLTIWVENCKNTQFHNSISEAKTREIFMSFCMKISVKVINSLYISSILFRFVIISTKQRWLN